MSNTDEKARKISQWSAYYVLLKAIAQKMVEKGTQDDLRQLIEKERDEAKGHLYKIVSEYK